jgi:hypothetical protein
VLTKHPFFSCFLGFFVRGKKFSIRLFFNYSPIIIYGVAGRGKPSASHCSLIVDI